MLRKLAKPVTGGEPAGLSLFCYIGVNTMTKKTFASFEQQIQHLEEKGIIISDRAYAESMLKQIGYFPLIGGYKHLFRVPFTKTYKKGTTFEEIVALYEFDSDLRDLFLKYLLQIERNLRSLMSYYFTEKYGESQDAYLDSSNYNTNRRNQKVVSRLISTLKYAANTTDYEFINYQRDTYGNIPLWVLVSVLTFGNLSKMYKVFPQSLQSKICKNFGIINQKQMEQFLSVLTKFRNVCAHSERLFTYRTRDTISDLPLHRKLSIPMQGSQYQYGKNDLFAVVIAFRYLLPDKDFRLFKKRLAKSIDDVSEKLIHIEHTDLLEKMGFPENWKNITRYRLTK